MIVGVWRTSIGPLLSLPNTPAAGNPLDNLNTNPELDFINKSNLLFNDELNPNPFLNLSPALFHDLTSLPKQFSNTKHPIFLSLNVQSLNSKIDKLKNFLLQLNSKMIFPDVIAIQETWNIFYPEMVQIPGYCFIYKTRTTSNGGGVGFYILSQLRYSLKNELSPFTDKTFESITMEVEINKRKFLLCNVYRSPTLLPNTSQTEQINLFNTTLDTLLSNLSSASNNAYVFLDSNINLLDISVNPHAVSYLETFLNNGFIQLIFKATRMQNNHSSLIDHILTNAQPTNLVSGTLITDISDHFITFTQPSTYKAKQPISTKTSRNLSKENIETFKLALNNLNWQTTLNSDDVDESFANFWNDFLPCLISTCLKKPLDSTKIIINSMNS